MMYRLVGDDWVILVYCPSNKQLCLFLAEPARNPEGKIISYWVSALERVGESRSALPGLPRSFKSTELAADWLEDEVERYKGDVFTPAQEAT